MGKKIFGVYTKEKEIVLSIVAGIISIIGLGISSFGVFQKPKIEKQDIFVKHIENLDEMSRNIKTFENFILEQKQNLLAEQIAIENLKKEKEILTPLLESDRKAVEALFIEQEKRQQKSIWYERAFGFFAGVLSSLLASFILMKVFKKGK